MMRVLRVLLVLALVAVWLTFGWVVGVLVLLGALLAYALRLRRTAELLEPTRRCGHCGFDAPTYGMFRCRGCGATTTGSVWFCALCGADYDYLPCPNCTVAIRAPRGGGR
jgi:hypothetical protein